MNKKIVSISIALFIAFIFQACITKSGMISMAEKEANKGATTPIPNTLKIDVEPEIVEIDKILPPEEVKLIKEDLIKDKIPSVKGKLIQIEGLVFKEVLELTINLETSSSQIEQIFAMKEYVRSNWHYIFDPKSSRDEWRSAEATISLKYKGKYSGDCDDFAILMASFARQVGLGSRVIGAYKNDGSGHAYAEFLVPKRDPSNPLLKVADFRTDYQGKWMSLDWFYGAEHRAYKNDVRVIAQ